MSDTSLVFNLVARDRTGSTLERVRERFDTAAAGIGAGVGAALGMGAAASLDMTAMNSKLAAQLDLSASESERVGKISGGLYADAYGSSMEEVNTAVGSVMSSIKGMSDASTADLTTASQAALNFASTFDIEVSRAVQSAGTLINSGLAADSTEAFDLITAASGRVPAQLREDVLDASDEYGQFFNTLGYSGEQSFALLVDASAKGKVGIDKAGDAIKEFTVLSTDMSAKSQAAYELIGLDAQTMANKILAGGDSAQGATQQIIDGLLGIKDPATQANAAIALFGTPLEDMNVKDIPAFLESLKGASGSMEGFGGAAERSGEKLRDNAKTSLTEFKRTVEMELAEVAGAFIGFAMDNQAVFEPLAYTLGGLAAAVLAIRTGMMVWAAAQTAWAAATAIATAAQWAWNLALWSNPITWIIAAIIALIVIIVLIATKTTWFQTIWTTVWGAITSFASGTVSTISGILSWFGGLPGMFGGWFGQAKDWAIQKMVALVVWVSGLPGRASAALAGLGGVLRSRAWGAFQAMRDAAGAKVSAFLVWVQGIPGRISANVGSLSSLLYGKGQDVVLGLWNGIKSMGGWLRDTLIGWAADLVPGPIAKALGIGSPSKVMAEVIGRWIPAGIAMGADDNRGVLDKTMSTLVDPRAAQPAAPLATGMAPLAGASAGGGQMTVVVDVRGADEDLKRLFRKIVRVDGRGSAQTAFGRG